MNRLYTIMPIGTVIETRDGFEIRLDQGFATGLDGLGDFSHALVFWWAHHFDNESDRKTLSAHSPYKGSPGQLGIFATRSPIRPNPVAVTAVQILSIDKEKGIIYIPYIDAENGTPVIDIKPYHPSADRIREAGIPSWCSHWPEWYEDSAGFNWEAEFNF